MEIKSFISRVSHSESSSPSSDSHSDSESGSGRLNCSARSRCKSGSDLAKINERRFGLIVAAEDGTSSSDVAGVELSWLLELEATEVTLPLEMEEAGECVALLNCIGLTLQACERVRETGEEEHASCGGNGKSRVSALSEDFGLLEGGEGARRGAEKDISLMSGRQIELVLVDLDVSAVVRSGRVRGVVAPERGFALSIRLEVSRE